MGSEGESSIRKRERSTYTADDQKPSSSWAKLVSADSTHSDMEIQADEMTINSSMTGLSSLITHNIFKIYRNVDSGIVKLQNLSSHGILINGQLLEEKEHMSIESGNEIVLGSERRGYPIYHVHVIHAERHSECIEKVSSLVDNLKCSICLNIWHDVVSVTPCLHNFCNACFSQWYRRSERKGDNCICPQCRSDVYSVGRNHSLRNIVEDMLKNNPLLQDMLKNNPSLQRSDEDIIQLDKDAVVQSDVMIIGNNIASQKSTFISSSVSNDDSSNEEIEPQCPQCRDTQGSGGRFHCEENTAHLQCRSCWELMPLRTDIDVPQMCVGCRKILCSAYWDSQNAIHPNSFYVPCINDALLPMLRRAFLTIPEQTHAGNCVEQDITKKYIRERGKTVDEIVHECITKLDTGEIEQPKLSAAPLEPITSATHLCNACSQTMVAHILHWFRLSIPKSELPPDVARREDCWWGHDCRTQHHNLDHARKLNHVCEATRRARR